MGTGTPGTPGYVAPKNGYGSGKAIGIGVGAAAAGSYTLEAGSVAVKPGDRVELKGKKSSGDGGAEMFEPTKVVKSLGSCNAEAAH